MTARDLASKEEEQTIARQKLALVSSLLDHEGWKLFVVEALNPAKEQADRDMRDMGKTRDERDQAVILSNALEKLAAWPAEQRAVFEKVLGPR